MRRDWAKGWRLALSLAFLWVFSRAEGANILTQNGIFFLPRTQGGEKKEGAMGSGRPVRVSHSQTTRTR